MESKKYILDFQKQMLERVKGSNFLLESGIPSPYIAPEGYFENMEREVLQKIRRRSNVFWLHSNWFRVAALLIFSVGFGFWMLSNKQTAPNNDLALLSDDEIYSYLHEQVSLDSEELLLIEEYMDFETETSLDYLSEEEILQNMSPELLESINEL